MEPLVQNDVDSRKRRRFGLVGSTNVTMDHDSTSGDMYRLSSRIEPQFASPTMQHGSSISDQVYFNNNQSIFQTPTNRRSQDISYKIPQVVPDLDNPEDNEPQRASSLDRSKYIILSPNGLPAPESIVNHTGALTFIHDMHSGQVVGSVTKEDESKIQKEVQEIQPLQPIQNHDIILAPTPPPKDTAVENHVVNEESRTTVEGSDLNKEEAEHSRRRSISRHKSLTNIKSVYDSNSTTLVPIDQKDRSLDRANTLPRIDVNSPPMKSKGKYYVRPNSENVLQTVTRQDDENPISTQTTTTALPSPPVSPRSDSYKFDLEKAKAQFLPKQETSLSLVEVETQHGMNSDDNNLMSNLQPIPIVPDVGILENTKTRRREPVLNSKSVVKRLKQYPAKSLFIEHGTTNEMGDESIQGPAKVKDLLQESDDLLSPFSVALPWKQIKPVDSLAIEGLDIITPGTQYMVWKPYMPEKDDEIELAVGDVIVPQYVILL